MFATQRAHSADYLRFATGVEAGVAVVDVGGSSLANDEGAQHRGR